MKKPHELYPIPEKSPAPDGARICGEQGVPGCQRIVFCKGLCRTHHSQQSDGTPLSPAMGFRAEEACMVDGCYFYRASRDGLCAKHVNRAKCGHPMESERVNAAVPCRVEGCGRRVSGDGYCGAHLKRLRRYGKPLAEIPVGELAQPGPPLFCTIPGCSRVHRAHGLCITHYAQWKSNGEVRPDTPEQPRRNSGVICCQPGCPRPFYAKNLCKEHYRKMRKAAKTRIAAKSGKTS